MVSIRCSVLIYALPRCCGCSFLFVSEDGEQHRRQPALLLPDVVRTVVTTCYFPSSISRKTVGFLSDAGRINSHLYSQLLI